MFNMCSSSPFYYYPYYLHSKNLLSFTHHNTLDETKFNNKSYAIIDLWSVSRWSYPKYKGTVTFTATYNYYTKNYQICGERFSSYNDLVNKALSL